MQQSQQQQVKLMSSNLSNLGNNNNNQMMMMNSNQHVSNNSMQQQQQLQQQLVQALLQQPSSLTPQQMLQLKQQLMLNQSLNNQVSNSLVQSTKSPQTPTMNQQHLTSSNNGMPSTPTNLSTNVSNNSNSSAYTSSSGTITPPINHHTTLNDITSSQLNPSNNAKLQESLEMIKQQHVLLLQRSNSQQQQQQSNPLQQFNNNTSPTQTNLQTNHHMMMNMSNNNNMNVHNHHNNSNNGNNQNLLSNNMNNIFNSLTSSTTTTTGTSMVTCKNVNSNSSYQGNEDINNMLLNSLNQQQPQVYILKEESMNELLEEGLKSLNLQPTTSHGSVNLTNLSLPIGSSNSADQILTISELEESLKRFTRRQSPTFNMDPPTRNNGQSSINRKMSGSGNLIASNTSMDVSSLKRKASIDIHSELDWITKKHK